MFSAQIESFFKNLPEKLKKISYKKLFLNFFSRKFIFSQRFISILMFFLTLSAIYFYFSKFRLSEAAIESNFWYDNSYPYRVRVSFSSVPVLSIPDFQVSFVMNTQTPINERKIKSDCSGITVVDDFGREIPYWIENCNSSNSLFYAKLNPSTPNYGIDIRGGSNQNVYVYYGNKYSNGRTFPPSQVFDLTIPDLKIAYNFEGDTSNLSFDLSGNSENLGKSGSPTTQPGAFGNAVVFNGSNHGSFPFSTNDFNFNGTFTFLAWARLDRTSPGTYNVLGIDDSQEYFELQFSVASNTSIFQRYMEQGTIKSMITTPLGSNYFYTGIKVNLDGNARMFYNQTFSEASPANPDYYYMSPIQYMKIGTGYFNSHTLDFFSGPIDEFRYFNRYLTDTEIQFYTRNTTIGSNYLSASTTCSQLNNYCTKSFVTPSFPGVDLLGKYNSLVTYTVSSEERVEVPLLYFKLNEGSGRTLGSSNLSGPQGYLGPSNSGLAESEYHPYFYDETKCIQGTCLYFDGFNDFVEIRTEPGVGNFDTRFYQKDISYSLWVKPFSTPNPNRRYLISMNTLAGSFMNAVYLDQNNRIVKFSSNASSTYSMASTSTIPYYKWSHISVTYDYETFTNRIYINGVLDRTAASAGDIGINVAEIGLGTSFEENIPSLNNFYRGLMDEVKFYDQEISSEQVQKDFNYGKFFLTKTQDFVARSNLMAYYPFDEADRGTAFDYSDIEAINFYSNTTLNNAPGLFNNAYSPPSNNAFFSLPNTSWTNLISTAAYSMWVYTGTHSSDAILLIKNSGVEGGGFNLKYIKSNSKFQGEICGTTLTSTSTSPAQMWNYVLLQSNSRQANLYVNSKLEATGNCINNYTGKISNTNPIFVGGDGNSNETILGMIDEFKIMENFFIPSQIEIHYNYFPEYSAYGQGPEAFYKLDEADGATAADDSVNISTNLQINNSANYNSWTEGIIGGSYDFSTQSAGVTNFMTGATANPLIEFNDSSYTFSAWIQFSAPHFGNAGSSNNLVFQYGQNIGGTSTDWVVLDANTFNNTNLLFRPSSWGLTDISESAGISFSSSYINTTNASSQSKWYHLTLQRSAYPTMFINGDIVSFQDSTGEGTSEKGLVLGNDFNNKALSLQLFAKLDEVKLYGYARNRDQIIRDMRNASTSPAFNSNAFSQIPTNLRSPIARATYGTLPVPIVYLDFDDPYQYSDLVYYTYFGTSAGSINFQKSNRTFDGYINNAGNFSTISELTFSSFTDFNFQNKDFAMSIFFKSPSNNENTTIAFSSTNFVLEKLNNKLNLVSTNYNLTSTNNLTTNAWNHIYLQRNKETKVLEMYLNGIFQGSKFASSSTIDLQNLTFKPTNTSIYLDEIKIFQNVIDQNLIKNLQKGGYALNLGSNYYNPETSLGTKDLKFSFCVLGDSYNCSPPEAFLKFDEQSNYRAVYQDYVDGGSIVAFVGGARESRVPGYSGMGISGSTNPAFTLNKSYLNQTGVASANFWFKIDPAEFTNNPVYFSEASNLIRYDRGSDLLLVVRPGVSQDNIWFESSLEDAKWRNLHYNINNGVMDFYLDGVYVRSSSRTLDATSESFSLANSTIDEIKFYEYERTPNQIAFEYSNNKPFVHLKFDECSGNKLFNSNLDLYDPLKYLVSGSIGRTDTGGHHVTGFNLTNPSGLLITGNCQTSGNTSWYLGRSGKNNSSLFFDTSIYATGNDFHMNQLNNRGEASISFWMKPTNASHTATIIGPITTSDKGYSVIYVNGIIQFERNSTGISSVTLLTSPSLSPNVWSHVAVTSEVSSTNQIIKMYINGIQVASDTVSLLNIQQDCSRSSINNPVICSANPAVMGRSYNGYLDEFKIYNFALTPEQVKSDKNNGAAVIFR